MGESPAPVLVACAAAERHSLRTASTGGLGIINKGASMLDWRDAPAGTRFIAGIGESVIVPDFDFETYSEAGYRWDAQLDKWQSLPGLANTNRGLGAVGTRNYVTHQSFQVLSLSWNLKDGKGVRWWRPDPNLAYYPRLSVQAAKHHPMELLEYVLEGGVIEAWNVYFEWQVWNYHCVPYLGWPLLRQQQCRDAMAKSRAAAFPGKLANAGVVLKLSEQKDSEGTRLIRKLTVPKNPTKGNPALRWTPFTAAEDFEKFYAYNRQDICTEAEASLRLPDLTPREHKNWQTDFRINMRGMQVDRPAIEDCIAIIEQAESKYNGELNQITNGAVRESTEVSKILAWAKGQGVYLDSLDEDTISAALKREDYPAGVLRVLRIRQMLAFGSVKKFYALRAQSTPTGRLYDQYVYYGAHTGLWNGQGVQPANLYKGIFSKPEEVERALAIIRSRCLELVEYEYHPHDALEVIASCLRSMFIASPGHRLISADFTAIQAVATSCMANETWRIDVFRTHGKIYEAMAAMLTGKPLQFYLDYKKQHGKHHPDRQLGKLAVLSADFGAWIHGWKRFGAEEYGDDEFIKQLILKTRSAIPNVCNLWGGQTINRYRQNEEQRLYGLEGAAISAVLQPGQCFSSRPGSPLGVLYQMHEDTLYCRPPSGGFIRYHEPRLQPSTRDGATRWEYELSYMGWNSNAMKGAVGWLRMKLYGGVFTQNTISHMCREVQADTLVRLETHGYPIAMHTHDENVADVLKGCGSVAHYMELVRQLPAWAVCEDGGPWPIKVPDAWEAHRYGKWED
jgi:DNA polymerase bacteriophage-type